MFRLRWVILVLGIALLTVTSTPGQDKKGDKDDPKVKNSLPAHWKELNLTAEQKDKVYKIQAEYKAKIEDLDKKIKELRAEEQSERVKVLTEEQKKKLKELSGLGEDKPATAKTYEGKFLSFKDDKLTINAGDKEKEFNVKDVKPLIDGKEGKWDDVKKDAKIKVTTQDEKVTKVEFKNP